MMVRLVFFLDDFWVFFGVFFGWFKGIFEIFWICVLDVFLGF